MLDQETSKSILEGKVITRAVLYARVSRDDRKNDGRNLQGQLEMGREYALGKDYRIVAELAEDDRGASGASIDLPQLDKIRDMAQRDEFDVLIVREIDRLSRNLAKQLIVEEELKRAGVSIEYVLADYEDTPEGRLNKHIRATIAEYEREKIRERLVRGRRNKVKAGSTMSHGRPPYGYKSVDANGLWEFQPVPDEAEIVRLIFRYYTIGDGEKGPMSIKAIAKRLTKMGAPTAADKHKKYSKRKKRGEWHPSTVWNILKNETYVGTWCYGKTKKVNGKQIRNPDDNLLAVNVQPLIDNETWQQAQKRLEKNKRDSKRNRKHDYLLSGHVFCGKCGLRMSGLTKNSGEPKLRQYYYCPAIATGRFAHKCTTPHFRLDKVDPAVWEWLVSVISDPHYLEEKLIEYQTKQDEINKPLRERIAVVNDLLISHEKELTGAMADLKKLEGREAKRAKARIYNDIERIEKTLDRLETERADLESKLQANSITPELIHNVLEFAAKVRENANLMTNDFEEKRWFIERLNVEVRLAVEGEDQVAYISVQLLGIENERMPIVSTTSNSRRSSHRSVFRWAGS